MKKKIFNINDLPVPSASSKGVATFQNAMGYHLGKAIIKLVSGNDTGYLISTGITNGTNYNTAITLTEHFFTLNAPAKSYIQIYDSVSACKKTTVGTPSGVSIFILNGNICIWVEPATVSGYFAVVEVLTVGVNKSTVNPMIAVTYNNKPVETPFVVL